MKMKSIGQIVALLVTNSPTRSRHRAYQRKYEADVSASG